MADFNLSNYDGLQNLENLDNLTKKLETTREKIGFFCIGKRTVMKMTNKNENNNIEMIRKKSIDEILGKDLRAAKESNNENAQRILGKIAERLLAQEQGLRNPGSKYHSRTEMYKNLIRNANSLPTKIKESPKDFEFLVDNDKEIKELPKNIKVLEDDKKLKKLPKSIKINKEMFKTSITPEFAINKQNGILDGERNEVAEYVQELSKRMDEEKKALIITQAIFYFPESEKKEITEYIQELSKEMDDEEEVCIHQIIDGFSCVPHSKRRELVDCVLKLSKGMDMKEKTFITGIFAKFAIESEWKELAEYIQELSMEMDVEEKTFTLEIIKGFALFPKNARRILVDYMRNVSRVMDIEEKIFITEIFAKFSKKEDTYPVPNEMSADEKALIFTKFMLNDDKLSEISECVKKLNKDMPQSDRIKILESFIEVPHGERIEMAEFVSKLFNNGMMIEEKIEIIKTLIKVPKEERAQVVECLHRLKPKIPNDAMDIYIKKIIEALVKVPKKERFAIVDSVPGHPGYILMNVLSLYSNPIMLFYLLPEHLKDLDTLLAIRKESGNIFNNKSSREAIVQSCQEKLTNLNSLPEETLLAITDFVLENHIGLLLNEDHPLMFQTLSVRSILGMPEEKSPFGIYKKLKDLSETPINFQPKETQLAGSNVIINTQQLQTMSSGGKVKREDLPLNATVEKWDELRNGIKNKVEADKDHAFDAFEKLDPESAPVNIWESIMQTAFYDSERFLSGLLESKGPAVSQREAKWRAVLSNILNKSNEARNGEFFTEREEYFVRTMGVIKNCSGGKSQGIDVAYSLLESKDQYKIKLAPPRNVDEVLEDSNRMEGINYIQQWLETDIAKNSKDKVQALVDYATKNTKESSGKLNSLLPPDEIYWNISKKGTIYALNQIGAKEVLKIVAQEKANETILEFVAQTLHRYIDKQFSGTNALMKELTGEKREVNEAPHQAIYLKNLIGPLVGVAQEIVFDQYTGAIHPKLLDRSREEVLEIFYKHVFSEAMINEIIRAVNETIEKSNENREMFTSYLLNEGFWDKTEKKLNQRGALELLTRGGYLKIL